MAEPIDGPRHPRPATTALVTGASDGIGREIALGLAHAGLGVALLGRDRARLHAAVDACRSTGVTAVGLVADVTDAAAVEQAVGQAHTDLGSLDLVVNNAGVIEAEDVPLWQADPDEWWRVMEVNVRGPFLVCRAAVPLLLAAGGGRVVDVNSGAGTRSAAGASAYYASKTALFRVTGALHEAAYAQGVRTFEVAPGVVRTAMTLAMSQHEGRTEWTPVSRVVELVTAVAAGRLDAWAGRFLHAGTDAIEDLASRGGRLGARDRTLGILPWGEDDPQRR